MRPCAVEVASSRLVSRSIFFPIRRDGRVVMQRPAKPCTPVRFRLPPPLSELWRHQLVHLGMRASDALLLARFADREALGMDELDVVHSEKREDVANIGRLGVARGSG